MKANEEAHAKELNALQNAKTVMETAVVVGMLKIQGTTSDDLPQLPPLAEALLSLERYVSNLRSKLKVEVVGREEAEERSQKRDEQLGQVVAEGRDLLATLRKTRSEQASASRAAENLLEEERHRHTSFTQFVEIERQKDAQEHRTALETETSRRKSLEEELQAEIGRHRQAASDFETGRREWHALRTNMEGEMEKQRKDAHILTESRLQAQQEAHAQEMERAHKEKINTIGRVAVDVLQCISKRATSLTCLVHLTAPCEHYTATVLTFLRVYLTGKVDVRTCHLTLCRVASSFLHSSSSSLFRRGTPSGAQRNLSNSTKDILIDSKMPRGHARMWLTEEQLGFPAITRRTSFEGRLCSFIPFVNHLHTITVIPHTSPARHLQQPALASPRIEALSTSWSEDDASTTYPIQCAASPLLSVPASLRRRGMDRRLLFQDVRGPGLVHT
ncbi:hypothetical protein BV25DRAFT_1843609 [Artomyces pyxidatus]|uniref:Uncharacterized protein n=1 Tax=Artomyces pyxidatus TaxID=48021 RepID=A0ACB8SET9_9AGAM|nr:hypothetical protein BV25DRAFT_1843609 [Artomyces pyxidatus]